MNYNIYYSLIAKFTIIVLLSTEILYFKIENLSFVMPDFMVMTIYFWGIYQDQKIFSKHFLFFTSLLFEILKGDYLGISTVPYFIFYNIISSQKKFFLNKPFIVVWVGFVIFAFIVMLVKIIILNFLFQKFVFYSYFIIQFILMSGLYTPVHWMYSIVKKQKGERIFQ